MHLWRPSFNQLSYVCWKSSSFCYPFKQSQYSLGSQHYQAVLSLVEISAEGQKFCRTSMYLVECSQGMRWLARVQRMHKPVDLWDITFCTRRFWGSKYYWHLQILRPRALFYRTDCTRRSKFLTHDLVAMTGGVLILETGVIIPSNHWIKCLSYL